MLRNRVKTAVIILPPAALLLWIGGYPAVLLAFLVCAAVNYEYFSFATPFGSSRILQLTAVNCLAPLGYLVYGFPGLASGLLLCAVLTVLCLVVSLESDVHAGEFETFVPASFAGVCYPGIPAAFLVVAAAEFPGPLTLWVVLVVAAADIFAYFGGRAIGGIRLAPRLSPKKTVAGVVAGVCGAALTGVAAGLLLPERGSAAVLAGSGVVIGFLSVFGDLAESLVKRIAGVKDSGSILPGHGGVLDRVDGLLFAVPGLFLVSRIISTAG